MELLEIVGAFKMDGGAPSPWVLSNEHSLTVLFYGDDIEGCYAVKFEHVLHHKFGIPGNETIHGHPYYRLGLMSIGFYELQQSDYIAQLKAISKVHDRFDQLQWVDLKHYIIAFHDTVFECVCKSYRVFNITLEEYSRISAIAAFSGR